MISIIDRFLHELKITGNTEKTIRDYSKFLKNINRRKSLEKWDKADIHRYIMEMHNECLSGTVDTYKVKVKRFFTWAGKPEIVNHLNT